MKYIIVGGNCSSESAILFPETINHADVGRSFRCVSAGFCYVEDGRWHVDGNSVSLGLESRPSDAKIIADTVGFGFGGSDED